MLLLLPPFLAAAGCSSVIQAWILTALPAPFAPPHFRAGAAIQFKLIQFKSRKFNSSRCSAVVHHGGAGTTASGLYCGLPTFIVPFFGDQYLWGNACCSAGVGPPPVPVDQLTTSKLEEALKYLKEPRIRDNARLLQRSLVKVGAVGGGWGKLAAGRFQLLGPRGRNHTVQLPYYCRFLAGRCATPANTLFS